MMINFWEKIAILFWFLIAFLICFESSKLEIGNFVEPGPGFFPALLGILLGVLSLLLFLKNRFEKEAPDEKKSERSGSWGKVFWAACSLLFYASFLNLVGFLLVNSLTVFFLFWKMGNRRWQFAFFASILTTFSCYLVFQVWLSANLPKGVLGF